MPRQNGIYESLGVTPLINAAGTFTYLGGSVMPPEVRQAWAQAAEQFVDLQELQDAVGVRIAALLGVESALVTGGAAAGIMLSVAAAVAAQDPEFLYRQTSVASGAPWQVIRQRCHRDLYDRQIESCGVQIIEVETVDDVRRRISERTVLMHCCNYHEPAGQIGHRQWLELAHQYRLPTLLDAAADVPPVENLWRYNQLGYDLVTFSGGKAIRGPQSAGLLLGHKHWIDAIKSHAVPNEGVIGRVAKVSKEDIVAMWRALELFVANGDTIGQRCRQQLQTIETLVTGIETVRCAYVTPAVANHFPHLQIEWDEDKIGLTPTELATRLRRGNPPIATERVYGSGDRGILISAINLQPGEDQIVAARIAHELQRPTTGA